MQDNLLHKIVWLTWCFEQVNIHHFLSFWIQKYLLQNSAIEEVKKAQEAGIKTAIAGDGRYDSPGNFIIHKYFFKSYL